MRASPAAGPGIVVTPRSANRLIMGGTSYTLSAIAAGSFLSESGGAIVGTTGSVAGSVPVWSSTSTLWIDSVRAAAIATTSTDGIVLKNTTAATSGVPVQYSTTFVLGGTAHDTDGNASVVEEWGLEVRPVNGNTVGSALHFMRRTAGGAWSSRANINQSGAFTLNGALTTDYLIVNGTDFTTGLSACSTIYASADNPIMLLNKGRTNAAGNYVNLAWWDKASATADDGLVLFGVGWTNNADSPRHVLKVKPKAVNLPSWAVAAAPTGVAGDIAYCTNGDTGSPCLAVSNGSNWLRVALGTAVAAS